MWYAILLSLSLWLWGGDLTRLGDDDFRVRQAAARRLEFWTPLTLPVIEEGLRSSDAETRHACAFLRAAAQERLRPWHEFVVNFRAMRLLYGAVNWRVCPDDKETILRGGAELHRALSRAVHLRNPRFDGISAYERDANNYSPLEMVGFVMVVRRRLRGLSDVP